MATLGTSSLFLILILATWAGALALVGARRRQEALVESAVIGVYAVAAISTLAMLLLVHAFVVSDFSISYVHQHSDRSMPLFYRVTAVWGGMEGSMLLWVWLQALVTAAAVKANRQRLREMIPYTIVILMAVEVFFAVLMVVHSNPFATYLTISPDIGKGLNPLLQNPYMVTHPPSLYLGFVGLSIPFALALGALLSGQMDDSWVHASRRWALAAWFFLALGLTLGMLWAYEELGWGGYWGWDPVENAGFMPWLIVTAFIHSIMVQERRQMLKRWNVVLAVLGFVMTIFGTFLTRSGFINSVHAFARSNIGYVFLAFIALVLVFSFALLLWRWRAMRARGELESVLSREFWFLLNNWVLLFAALLVMVLTIFPNISELFGDKITISVPAFNRWMVPVGLVLILITAVGPMLGWRSTSVAGLRRQFAWPLAFTAAVVGLLFFACGVRELKPMLAWGLSTLVVGTIAQEIARAAWVRSRAAKVSYLAALFGLFTRNQRRYGGYVVHLGLVVMCVGFAGEAFKTEKEVVMRPGQQLGLGEYTLRFDGTNTKDDGQKVMLTASLSVSEGSKKVALMQPARWVFHRHKNSPTTEVAIRRTLGKDLFVALGNVDEASGAATFKLVINPLVNWIWIGFLIMALGTALAAIPLRLAGRRGSGAALALLICLAAPGLEAMPTTRPTAKPDHAVDRPIILTTDGAREQALFAQISCMCPNCPRIPLASCQCGFASKERTAIRRKITAGWSERRVLDWYTTQRGRELGGRAFGAEALALPPDTAFNRLAWLVPYLSAATAAALLLLFGLRRQRRTLRARQEAPINTSADPETSGDDPYARLLDEELRELD